MSIMLLKSIFSSSFFLVFFTVHCLAASNSKSKLHPAEVKALKEIAKKLGKRDWDFDKDPCSGEGNWSVAVTVKGLESSVACDCSFNNNSTCHITSIALKAQNISANVPPEFAQLRHLKQLDLSRNYLNGSIPSQWASLRLLGLSVMGNHLSGPFPKVLTKIPTLRNLSIEGNRFSGSIPPEIGNLVHMEKLVLSSNEFTGALPPTLAKLTNLTDLRISDNNFTGKIPKFISNWTKIEKLHIQGCSLEGPIPSAISSLTSLIDLRISDLKSGKSGFPPLDNLESMKVLILRKCLIHGEIPEYIGDMKKLKTLDLSFNSLSGEIPSSFLHLSKVDFMYLTGNKLTGPVPEWILSRNKNVDVSYNNFTWETTAPIECPRGSVNLVESYSALGQESNKVHPCLKHDFPCSEPTNKQQYSLYINCGGKEVSIKNGTSRKTYEADLEARGASMYYSRHNWAFSSTGNFMDNDVDSDVYIDTNVSALLNVKAPEVELYKTARASPLSLTYYGQCLMNGNYTVKLHFAEIIFTNDTSFNSLGERIFDVYLQENLVLKDFNIAKEAGGPGQPIVKTFTAAVTSHTLKIHFYWAGKGTTGIPVRGVYGPLISAISVDPNFTPPLPAAQRSKIHVGILAGAIAGSVFVFLLIIGILYKRGCLGEKVSADKELQGLDLQAGLFTLRQIKAATKNFDPENKIGEGGFGSVYKGLLSDGTVIAVKQLSSKSKQGTREFLNEVGMISAVQHPNLVKLYGCCIQGNQLLLVYEYMENNCVSRALFGKGPICKMKLDWPTRRKICLGIARGLAYLHEESSMKIVHRDIKTSNILLDKDFNPKISDFGLAKLHEDDNTHISTRIAGTVGYMAPEYAMRGYLTSKADIYSYGVVALEIVSGKSNTNYRPAEDCVYLLDWAYVMQERGSILELVDPDLCSNYSTQEAMVVLNVALSCTNASPTLRPTMSQVVSMLEGQTLVQDVLSDPGISTTGSGFRSMRSHFWQTQSLSTDGTRTDSTISIGDGEENGILQRVESSVLSNK
ncbi:putative LRR receptor-like serine/threonine-protein kinase At1g07650 [Nicotiana tabacum]|uniref:non-specific serine/threonine protein kinase n=1 Tax=Nicotiana tabacum TaxID=4097 RepID=A0A1S4CTG0_TOBAC|nr:probable LRR receptor-like serine/threonine-protein kinase At1g07650 isoform X2 [Nicotiana tomentosiformis]XP_016504517.1 PREDICTED: probable LRR receptor-like serine/threonine-protein kinase At1g07650 [Nicotiana tabacum]